jgi:hypothetical protein
LLDCWLRWRLRRSWNFNWICMNRLRIERSLSNRYFFFRFVRNPHRFFGKWNISSLKRRQTFLNFWNFDDVVNEEWNFTRLFSLTVFLVKS